MQAAVLEDVQDSSPVLLPDRRIQFSQRDGQRGGCGHQGATSTQIIVDSSLSLFLFFFLDTEVLPVLHLKAEVIRMWSLIDGRTNQNMVHNFHRFVDRVEPYIRA